MRRLTAILALLLACVLPFDPDAAAHQEADRQYQQASRPTILTGTTMLPGPWFTPRPATTSTERGIPCEDF